MCTYRNIRTYVHMYVAIFFDTMHTIIAFKQSYVSTRINAMNFVCWFFSAIHVISATRILYVLPDNVSDVNCPSQPCATLGQYLLDNGSLPVISNVEYHFLPGEHHVADTIAIEEAFNFSLIGLSSSPAKLICRFNFNIHMSVLYSYNVAIKNLELSQCSGKIFSYVELHIAVGLFLYECSHCKVENILFIDYGFAGINLLLNSHLKNITIDMAIEETSAYVCSPKFFLMFLDTEYHHTYDIDTVLINEVFISGHSEKCYEYHEAMGIWLHNNNYSITVEMYDSQFYNMDQKALDIQMKTNTCALLIKNCTFTDIKNKMRLLDHVIYAKIFPHNVTIRFENCGFYSSRALTLLQIEIVRHSSSCLHPSNTTFENCNFISNERSLLILSNDAYNCKVNVFFDGNVKFSNNTRTASQTLGDLLKFSFAVLYMKGTITFLENIVVDSIIELENSDVMLTKTVTFLSNICGTVINLVSLDFPYIIIMEYANISFINQIYQNHLIYTSAPKVNDYDNISPYCIFQYMVSANEKYYTNSELFSLYNISFSENKLDKQTTTIDFVAQANSLYISDYLTHCKWLPTAVFNGHRPGYVNQQIVRVDNYQWIHYKRICYCPHDQNYNCTIDLLGPIYPGQKLQVELCMPLTESNVSYNLYVKTHSSSLPNSTCKVAHQTELFNSIGNYAKIFNFTIISESESCELFLVMEFHDEASDAFYVQLLPCPVGFTLQNGKCGCDPSLPPDIDTCYIDQSAIGRPANTWITAHTVANNVTNYLISDCPMDYCLPYSTNVDLLYPDLQCQFNRTGVLCSQCQHPLSMVFGSSRCMKCTNVHILITIIVLVAGIVLVVLLYVLNLTVTNGTINGIIFYANIISINDSVFLVNDNVFKPLKVFISFTNLDLGIETCFYNGMDSYAKMWLQLFFPSYLILIAASIIIASRYSSRMLRLTYSRSLPVLATLFLLSYTGVLRVASTVLFSYSTITHYPSGDKQIVWSIDSSIPLFGNRLSILFIACVVLFLLLILLSIALLLTRLLSRFRMINYFKPLLDAFQGSYKDKYYNWIAVTIIIRMIIFSLYVFQSRLKVFLAATLLAAFTACYGYACPHKNKAVNIQDLSLLVNLTIMHTVPLLDNNNIFTIVTNFLISLTFIQFFIATTYHFFTHTFHCNVAIKEKLIKCIMTKNKRSPSSYNVELLNVPECTYNYTIYRDELISDDFK